MANNEAKQIGKEIFDTIKSTNAPGYGSGTQAIMGWGAEHFVISDDEDVHGKGWLQFKVNGTVFKGYLRITKTSKGLYTLVLENHNPKTGEFAVLQKIRDIDPAEITKTIDEIVEGERV